jgi:membrane-associated protease RseP (regulator of RpoE activity)
MVPPDPLQQAISTLKSELLGLFQVSNVVAHARGQVISFAGRLIYDAASSYEEINRRFHAHGYTPLLRRENDEDVVVALEGVVDASKTGNPLINLLLLVVTIFTTLQAGASISGEDLISALFGGSVHLIIRAAVAGAPFAVTLMTILGVHELGHYAAARWHGVAATLPYFIPMPFNGLGTLGAFIAVRSPMRDRQVLFDIGLAGPVAGLAMALPLLVVGLLLSPVHVPLASPGLTMRVLGSSILVDAVVEIFKEVPQGRTLLIHPVFYAAWWGLLVTGINLLPVGQLDGGHVAYGLFGRRAHLLAYSAFAVLMVAGLFYSRTWLIWAFFVLLGGLRHPAPLNDITGLSWPRRLAGGLTALLFVLIIIPNPFPLR